MTNHAANKNNEPTAAEAYAAKRNDIARLIDVLQMELERQDENAKANPRSYGPVANIGKVRSDLINAVGFLSNKDPHEVEAFLADAE